LASQIIECRRATVEDWKKDVERAVLQHPAHGPTAPAILQDTTDPSHFLVRLEFESVAEARRFIEQPETRPAWHQTGAEEAWVMSEAEVPAC
jgi:hypothetical protein